MVEIVVLLLNQQFSFVNKKFWLRVLGRWSLGLAKVEHLGGLSVHA
jgi:hypothetical protein